MKIFILGWIKKKYVGDCNRQYRRWDPVVICMSYFNQSMIVILLYVKTAMGLMHIPALAIGWLTQAHGSLAKSVYTSGVEHLCRMGNLIVFWVELNSQQWRKNSSQTSCLGDLWCSYTEKVALIAELLIHIYNYTYLYLNALENKKVNLGKHILL